MNESDISIDNEIEEEGDGDSAEIVDLGGRSSLEGLTQRRTTTAAQEDEEKDEMEGGDSNLLYDGGDPLIRQPVQELTWSDFNVDFHSSVDDINDEEFATVNLKYGPKQIDIRPYMVARPFTVSENDPLQKCLDQFRLMNLRHMPVICEKDCTVAGIITRQDLFAFMSI